MLRYEEVPIPEPGPDEILIKVEAASLNRADLALRKGGYRTAPEQLPLISGREFAGTVAKLGARIQEFTVGQSSGMPGKGGYAECARQGLGDPSNSRWSRSGNRGSEPTVFLTAWFASTAISAQVLERFMVNGWPDDARFEQVIAGLIKRGKRRGEKSAGI